MRALIAVGWPGQTDAIFQALASSSVEWMQAGGFLRVSERRSSFERRRKLGRQIYPIYPSFKVPLPYKQFDLLAEVSENNRIKFLFMEHARELGIPAVILYYEQGDWFLAYYHSHGACHACHQSYTRDVTPPILLPKPQHKAVMHTLRIWCESPPAESVTLNLSRGGMQILQASPQHCPICKKEGLFLLGLSADISSKSCTEITSSVSPTADGYQLDLPARKEALDPVAQPTRVNPFFLEYCIDGRSFTLSRQGRLIMHPSKKVEESLFMYRWFVGS